jgi:hypothetical protein
MFLDEIQSVHKGSEENGRGEQRPNRGKFEARSWVLSSAPATLRTSRGHPTPSSRPDIIIGRDGLDTFA